jgi:hypothetical protein
VGRWCRKAEYSANTVYTLYVNGKMRPVETIPGIGERE